MSLVKPLPCNEQFGKRGHQWKSAVPPSPDRAQLREIVQRVRDGRLRTNIGIVSTLDDAVAALNPTERRNGKTIIRVRP